MNMNKVRMPGAILLLIILTLLTACQTTTVNLVADGTPLPTHVNRLSNPETEISATVSFVRQFEYTEGKESVYMPEYLPFGNIHKIDPLKTKTLLMAIHVYNPKRVEYEMWESHRFWYTDAKWPTHVQRCFYQGRMSTRDYKVTLPLKGIVKAESQVQLRDPKSGSVIMSFGDANYTIIGGK